MKEYTNQNHALSKEGIIAHLATETLGREVHFFESVTSTFDEADRLNPSHGTLICAKRQTNGRGRLGRQWLSQRGGIYFSLIIRPREDVKSLQVYTAICALGVQRAISSLVPCTIKWPNDIVSSHGKKLCGILTEGEIDPETGAFSYAVIGAGINVFSVPPEVSDIATALQLHTEGCVDRNLLCAKMIDRIIESLSEERSAQMREYRRRCPIAGKEITVLRGEERFSATALSVEEDGSLLIEREGEKMLLSSGEISIRE